MRWRAGERPRKSWMNCGDFWTSTRGEADEQLRQLDYAGGFADAWLDVVALPLARRGAGGSVCGGGGSLPKRAGALRAGGGGACFDDDVAGRHFLVVACASESGRANWGGRGFDVGGDVHPKRDRAARLPLPSCRISSRTTHWDVVVGGSVVSGCPFAEPEDRGRIDADRKNAAQRDPGGGGGI